ncbi:hypothetical protein HN51_044194 [Arachis hypogaea]
MLVLWRQKLTALPLKKNVLFACCCTISVSTYLLLFFHILSSYTWTCGVLFTSILIEFWFDRRVVLAQIIFYFILENFEFYWGIGY